MPKTYFEFFFLFDEFSPRTHSFLLEFSDYMDKFES